MRIPFYFDYSCPWAYLGSCRVEAYFRDLGVEIDFRPIVLADVKEPTAGKGVTPGDRKKRYFAADLRHWAEFVGANFALRAFENRRDTRLLLRAALAAREAGRFREFHYPAYRARWAEARNVDEPDVVAELLEQAGLSARPALDRAQSDDLGRQLDEETKASIARGVFGVPTLFVGDEMFWGNDRFELARHTIRKQSAPRAGGPS
jgi:2-hydroxychromene-2-carboxylate isomerase